MKKQVVLITGASSGIGEATAIALQKEGYQVYAGARRLERMQHLISLGIKPISLDVTNEESMVNTVLDILKAEGGIDVLINNAGYGSYGALEDVPMSEARRQVEVNLFGMARLTQLVLPAMREAKHGKIINTSSIGGKFGEALGSWYHATKYAVEGLGDSLALELAPFGIKVVTIEPGAINTEWSDIAEVNLNKVSSGGAYTALVNKRNAAMKRLSQRSLGSEPSVVADGIVKILAKKNPKLRYAIGGGAKPLLIARKLTSDRVFYGLLNRIVG